MFLVFFLGFLFRVEDEIYWGHRRMEMMGGPMPPEFMDWQRFGPMGPMMRPPFPMHPMVSWG